MNIDGESAPIFLAGVLIAVRELSRLGLLVKQKSNGGTHEDKTLLELRSLNTNVSNLATSVRTSNRIFTDIIGNVARK